MTCSFLQYCCAYVSSAGRTAVLIAVVVSGCSKKKERFEDTSAQHLSKPVTMESISDDENRQANGGGLVLDSPLAVVGQNGLQGGASLKEGIISITSKYKGSELRKELDSLIQTTKGLSPDEIISALEALPLGSVSESALRLGVGELAEADPERAIEWVVSSDGLSDLERGAMMEAVGYRLGNTDPKLALGLASSLNEVEEKLATQFTAEAIQSWAFYDAENALAGVKSLAGQSPELAMGSLPYPGIVSRLLAKSEDFGLLFGGELGDGDSESRSATWFSVLGRAWAQHDPARGVEWAASSLSAEANDVFVQALFADWTVQRPSEALTWVQGVKDQKKRNNLIRRVLPSIESMDPDGAKVWRKYIKQPN